MTIRIYEIDNKSVCIYRLFEEDIGSYLDIRESLKGYDIVAVLQPMDTKGTEIIEGDQEPCATVFYDCTKLPYLADVYKDITPNTMRLITSCLQELSSWGSGGLFRK